MLAATIVLPVPVGAQMIAFTPSRAGCASSFWKFRSSKAPSPWQRRRSDSRQQPATQRQRLPPPPPGRAPSGPGRASGAGGARIAEAAPSSRYSDWDEGISTILESEEDELLERDLPCFSSPFPMPSTCGPLSKPVPLGGCEFIVLHTKSSVRSM